MKKLKLIFNRTCLSALSLALGVSLFANKTEMKKLNVSAEDHSYVTDLYTLTYQNNRITLLLSADFADYSNINRSVLSQFKDEVLDVAYSAIIDDIGVETKSSTPKSRFKPTQIKFNDMAGLDVDISSVSDVIASQLSDYESIDEALADDGKYDILLEFYVDRYVDVYLADNPTKTYDEVVDEIANELKEKIQEQINEIYENNGELEYAPSVSDKIDTLINEVKDTNAAGDEITITLGDVTDIIKSIEDSNQIVNIINEIEVDEEIYDIVVASNAEELTDFVEKVDIDTIIDVFEEVEFESTDIKNLLDNIGIENLSDIADIIGMQDVRRLLSSFDYSDEDLKDFFKNSFDEVSLTTIIKLIKTISVNDEVLFDKNDGIKQDGLYELINTIPAAEYLKNFTDEQMKFTWALDIETTLGDVDFEFTLGFKGDCSSIRQFAEAMDYMFDWYFDENDVFHFTFTLPQDFDDAILRLCNSEYISQDQKQATFNLLFAKLDDIYNYVTSLEFQDLLDDLKTIDYQAIVTNFYNAETLNEIMGTSLTEEDLDSFVDGIGKLISEAAAYDYDRIYNFVTRYIDLSAYDLSAVEAIVDEIHEFLVKLDARDFDSRLVRKFIDPNSGYTNENVFKYIDKLSRYENYYNDFMNSLEMGYANIPDYFKSESILDLYKGDGIFNFTGTFFYNMESILVDLFGDKGHDIYDAYAILFEQLPTEFDINITVDLGDIYKVTYHYGDNVKAGCLPAGANIKTFAGVTQIDGSSIQKWVDVEGNEYTTMPKADIDLYAYTDFYAYIEDGVEKTYDAEASTLTVVTEPDEYSYTYQWYKDDEAIAGANAATYDVKDVDDSGFYYCIVSSSLSTNKTNEVEVVIEKAKIDVSGYTWDYESAFTYDGTEKTVSLKDASSLVELTYTDNAFTNAGTYEASVECVPIDPYNYEVVGEVGTLSWTINPATVAVDWDVEDTYTYTGDFLDLPMASFIDVFGELQFLDFEEKDGKEFKNAGTYTFVVCFDDDNYILTNTECDVTVNKATFDLSTLTWDYDDAFTYDSEAKVVELVDVPDFINVDYIDNNKTNANDYVAKATATVNDTNYELTGSIADLTWKINKLSVTVTWDAESSYTYNNETLGSPTATITVLGGTPIELTVSEKNGKTFKDAGDYTFVVDNPDTTNYELVNDELNVTVNKAQFDLSTLTWDYDAAFTYDGEAKVVVLEEVPSYVDVDYLDNNKTNANDYVAKATATVNDTNYELTGSIANLSWKINKAEVEVTWTKEDSYTYTGETLNMPTATALGLGDLTVNEVNGKTFKDAGEYKFTVDNPDSTNYNLTNTELEITVSRKQINLADFAWNYENAFTYDGNAKEVTLLNVPNGISISYTDNNKTNANTYTATANATQEANNFELVGSIPSLSWTINKAEVEVTWTKEDAYTYTGEVLTMPTATASGLGDLTVNEVNGKEFKDAGDYKFTVINPDSTNYELTNTELEVTVNKAQFDLSTLAWNYDVPFTYDGTAKEVTLLNVPSYINVSYENNSKTNANTYTATALATVTNENYELVGTIESVEFVINKAVIDTSSLTWNYENAFEYDDASHKVELNVDPTLLVVTYTDNEFKEVGKYNAAAIVSLVDLENYEISGNTLFELTWEIINTNITGTLTDPNGYVSIVSALGQFNGTDKILANDVTEYVDIQKVLESMIEAGLLDKNTTIRNIQAYNISFTDKNGNSVSYNDKDDVFTVRVLIPEELRSAKEEHLYVIFVDDEYNVEIMDKEKTYRDGDYMVYETTHFSMYAVIEIAPKYGWIPYVIIILLAAIILVLIILLLKKKHPVVEEKTTLEPYYVVIKRENDIKIVSEVQLDEVAKDDIVSNNVLDEYTIGKSSQDNDCANVELFTNAHPVKTVLGKVNEEDDHLEFSLYKNAKKAVALDENKNIEIIEDNQNTYKEEKSSVVEIGKVIENDEEVVYTIYKNKKTLN